MQQDTLTLSAPTCAAEPPSPARLLRITLLLGLLTAFAPFATDMYLSSFPDIARHFHSDVGRVQLSLSTFIGGLAIGQLLYGPLIDRFGRRLPLLCGIALFAASSLLAIFAPGMASFVGLRALQALGGCAGMVISRAVIQDLFDTQQAARALSLMMLVQGIGPVAAPIAGGYLLAVAPWWSVFAFLTLLALVCYALTFRELPETLAVEKRQRQSLASIAKVFGLQLAEPGFLIPTLASSLTLAAMFAFISGSSFVYMTLHGVPQHLFGWLFGLNTLGMVAASQLNRFLLQRFTPRRLFIAAMLISAVAALALFTQTSAAHLWQLALPLFFCTAPIPVLGANAVAIAMAHSGKNAGSASSIVGVMQFGCAGLSAALVGLLHDGTAWPMTVTMLGCALTGLLVLILGRRQL